MAFCDFAIQYNPEVDTSETVTKKILYSLIIKRLKAHKPAVIFIGGDSGEGKSLSAVRFKQLLLEIQGLDIRNFLNDINVYLPIEYPQKLDRLLYEKELKKVNILCMHEAREVVKAKLWYSFLNQATADINAMSRAVKRLCIIIISQFIRDISNDIRYTLNYYCKVSRPKGKKARLYFYVLWKDDSDLEKPKLRKRKLSGYLIYPSKVWRRYVPKYLEMNLPPKEIVREFERQDLEAKTDIIKRKIDKLVKEMKADLQIENVKVSSMVKFYTDNVDSLNLIGQRRGKNWKVHKDVRFMHDLTPSESKQFERELNEKLKVMHVI